MFHSGLGLNRVSLGRKGFSSVFFVRFSVRSRTSSGGPFWTPGGPQNRLQIGPVAPARLGVAPGAVSGRPGEPPGPVLGSKTGGPDPYDSMVFYSRNPLLQFSAREPEKTRKNAKIQIKINAFLAQTGSGGPPKVCFFGPLFSTFFLASFLAFLGSPGGP